ncbi:MAG: sugar ABC transporter substrate-binding protein [Actinomycetota bacterium]|nr:sugar ABC transporter substrate-binding protein [Actinomycetota bacterium]
MKKIHVAAIFAVASLLVAGCGGDDDDASSSVAPSGDTAASTADTAASADTAAPTADTAAPADDTVALTTGGDITIHMVTHSDDGPFWSVVKRGADQAAADLGITVVWAASNNDPAKQVQLVDAAVAEGANGIASSLPSPDQLVGPLQAAVEAGIPVITLNSGVNDYQDIGALTHVGQTEVIAGNGAGERFNAAGATKIFCGRQEESNVALEERCDGLAETFEGEVISEFVGRDTDQTAQEAAINAALSADPDIDGFMGTGPVIAMSGLRAVQALGLDATVGGFDITPELIDAIEAGDVAFTVDQQQYLQGYIPVLLLFLNITNQNTLGGGLPILTGPGFVTPDNAAAVKALVAAGTR